MNKESKLTDLLALLVLAVFAVCVLMVLMTGTGVYRRLLDGGEAGFAERTCVRYITTRAHQAPALSVEDFEGISALSVPEEIDGERYQTLVYWHEGYIRELYCAQGARLYPEDGEKVLASEAMTFSASDDLLTVHIGGDRVFLHLPVGKAVGK